VRAVALLERGMDSEEQTFREMFPLVIVVLAALALLFLVAALAIGGGDQTYVPSGMTRSEVVAQRVQPIGEVNMGGPVVAEASTGSGDDAAGPRAGEAVYTGVCSACHANGTLGAPELGNAEAWQTRAQKGLDTLVQHSYAGFKQMPAQKAAASREEIQRAVTYMLEEAGVEP
jgi:cytochrome c5